MKQFLDELRIQVGRRCQVSFFTSIAVICEPPELNSTPFFVKLSFESRLIKIKKKVNKPEIMVSYLEKHSFPIRPGPFADPTRLLLESTYTSQKEVLFYNQMTFIRSIFF